MGALLTFALDASGHFVHINEVANGSACKCICPLCKSPLDAKNGGNVRDHHFAHSHGCICEGAYETSLHMLAKEIIQEQGGVMLPNSENGTRPSGYVKLHDIQCERWDDTYKIRPDVEGIMEDGRRLLIECLVTHKVDKKKQKIIVDNNLLCIEVDLNWLAVNKAEVTRFLTQEKEKRHWVLAGVAIKKSDDNGSISYRNPMYDNVRDLIKNAFDNHSLSIMYYRTQMDEILARYRELSKSKFSNLHDLGYDDCKVGANFRGFPTDLLLSRSQKEDHGYIAICIRGRRRNNGALTPQGLRIIDVIVRGESIEQWQKRLSDGILNRTAEYLDFKGDWHFYKKK